MGFGKLTVISKPHVSQPFKSSDTIRCIHRDSKSSRVSNAFKANGARKQASKAATPAGYTINDITFDIPLTSQTFSLKGFAQSRSFQLFEVVIVLLLLAAVDAGYSGDWSRIGVLTEDQELRVQGFVQFSIAAHFALGVIAGWICYQREERGWFIRFAKTIIVGSLGLVEAIYVPKK